MSCPYVRRPARGPEMLPQTGGSCPPAGSLLLAGDRLGLALAGARIGMRALSPDGEALAVTQAAIAGEIHEPLDVHRGLATKIAFHGVTGVDRFAKMQHFLVGQVL